MCATRSFTTIPSVVGKGRRLRCPRQIYSSCHAKWYVFFLVLLCSWGLVPLVDVVERQVFVVQCLTLVTMDLVLLFCLFTGTQRITAPVVDIDATCSSDKSLPEDLEKILVDAAEAAALKKAKKKKKKKKKKKN